MHEYIIYTDGGYSNSDNVGSGAFVILRADGQTVVKQDSFVLWHETSQRAELKAIIAAIHELPDRSHARIFTDYQYTAQSLGTRPHRKNKPDIDLLLRYRQLIRYKKLVIEFEWIPSDSDNHWHEVCDNLCAEALAELGRTAD